MRKLLAFLSVVLIVSCSSVDCPVYNMVATNYRCYNSNGDSLKLTDTLSVYTKRKDGTDTLILNKLVGRATFSLPVSYSHPEDKLVFSFSNGKTVTTDTVWVKKDDIPHFESIDCNAKFFHTLTGVRSTTNKLDSVVIKNTSVNYDATTIHFYLYPKVSD